MMNKRVVWGLVLTVVLVGTFLLGVLPALAADTPNTSNALAIGGRGNGRGAGGPGVGFVDADGDSVCDNYGTGLYGYSTGFVDADGDGICDNCGNFGQQSGTQARGYRNGSGRAR
ncbi:MAG TPA: hypothetical protein PKD55_11610 [Bellilinea sp.]|nr:hypothetical protein [Bellilinea sp.]